MAGMLVDAAAMKVKFDQIFPYLNESLKRKYLASEALALGPGGIKTVSSLSGVHRNTISAGIREIKAAGKEPQASEQTQDQEAPSKTMIRAAGGGRKSLLEKQPELLAAVKQMVDPASYTDPARPLRWTVKSLRIIAEDLQRAGFSIHKDKVGDILRQLGFSLQPKQKMKQAGPEAECRAKQFAHICETATACISQSLPVIAIDCRKRQIRGSCRNNEADCRSAGYPAEALDHAFSLSAGEAELHDGDAYGSAQSDEFVSVGISPDTAVLAANAIRNWWHYMGRERYPEASKLYLTASIGGCGGNSSGYDCRLWKQELQKLARELGFPIEVSHFPPGTSKWSQIEHQMISQITGTWQGKTCICLEVTVSLIGAPTRGTGQQVKPGVDENTVSEAGRQVADEDPAGSKHAPSDFSSPLNYTIFPS